MNIHEAIKLCRLVSNLCPSQKFDEFTPEAWSLVLDGINYDDAKLAIVHLGALDLEPGRSRYIEPGHIIAEVKRIRARRVETHPPVEPPLDLDPSQYIAWQRATTKRIADGEVLAQRPATAITDGSAARAVAQIASALPRPA